ncbi:DJ-1/PfpI family protein [Halobacterium bonnevillei]|uniref:DJ-1/PfpI family protein n=1 Tax=Halobacterium bonnevillei TaxID=2692200 RepID=A0A6B0SK27_9EURY|nr:DJ-1/PfpI family protein [Halobacterium bonnevillei]MXR19242.1 DJ-1/PfpI family protein [Halobacterium bonnevillei]
MDVAILLYEGFDELDAIGPYEVFRTAAEFGADVDATLRTLVPSEQVTASHGLRVEPDDVLIGTPDLVVVPGGGWNDRAETGTWAEYRDGQLPDRLATLHDGGAVVASVCTGAMLLADAGLLDGRPATTHDGAKADLREYDVDVRDDRYVDDGTILTAGGVTSGIDLALHVVERECSPGVAERVSDELEYDTPY